MPNYSRIIQIGHLCADPELRYTPSGTAVTSFTLATNHGREDKAEVCFIDVVLFGKQAETASQYLTKGSAALIEGRLAQEKWEDKQTGAKHSKHKIVGDRFVFLGSKGGKAEREPGDDSELEELPF